MANMNKKKTKLALAVSILMTFGLSNFASASTTTSETEHYLVIATGQSSGSDQFQMSDVEIGAVQEFISDGYDSNSDGGQRLGGYIGNNKGYQGGLDLSGKFTIADATRDVVEGIDYSGNVALIGSQGDFTTSNDDVNANDGILCAGTCSPDNVTDSSFFSDVDGNNVDDAIPKSLNVGNGTTHNVDFSGANGLINDLTQQREWILGLETDVTWTDVSQFTGDSGRPITTNIDGLNSQTDGENKDYVVIDLNIGGKFHLNNMDWVIESLNGLTAIFRMVNGTHYDFATSSIMLSDGTGNDQAALDGELGAIFYQDAYKNNNQVFNLDNVILGGIGLWDFTDFNPEGGNGDLMYKDGNAFDENGFGSVWTKHSGTNTEIKMSNAQGCAQFISNTVIMSNNRWARCARGEDAVIPPTEVPEPSTILLLALGLFGLRIRNKAA